MGIGAASRLTAVRSVQCRAVENLLDIGGHEGRWLPWLQGMSRPQPHPADPVDERRGAVADVPP